MTRGTVRAHPITESFGAVITGADLRGPLTEDDGQTLQELLADRSLLLFRGLQIDLDSQIRLVSLFGPVGDEQENGSYHSYVSNARPDGLAGDARLPYHSDFTYTALPHLVLSLYGEVVGLPTQPTWFTSRWRRPPPCRPNYALSSPS